MLKTSGVGGSGPRSDDGFARFACDPYLRTSFYGDSERAQIATNGLVARLERGRAPALDDPRHIITGGGLSRAAALVRGEAICACRVVLSSVEGRQRIRTTSVAPLAGLTTSTVSVGAML